MADLKVACATITMSSYFRRHFHDLSVLGNSENIQETPDLLILTGGEDVNPSLYREMPNGASGWNDHRDTAEMGILHRLIHEPKVKILGVCRGLQLVNVFLGGNLIQDLGSIGKEHTSMLHNLEFSEKDHPLSWIERTNSLHHQAVLLLGSMYGLLPKIVAVENTTKVPEIVTWGNRILGVQFHPELEYSPDGDKFFSVVEKWVKGEIALAKNSEYKSIFNIADITEHIQIDLNNTDENF